MKRLFLKDEWTSLYIPCIDSSFPRELLKTMFEHKYKIGKISFIEIEKLDGEAHMDDFSVVLHFEYWYYNKFTTYLRKYFQTHTKYNMKNHKKYYPTNDTDPVLVLPLTPEILPDNFVIMKRDIIKASKDESHNDAYFRLEKRVSLLEEELNTLRDLVLLNDF